MKRTYYCYQGRQLLEQETLIELYFALGEGKYKSVAVTLGRLDDDSIQIESGLYEGDIVVSSAQFLLDSESNKTSDLKRIDSTRR